MRGTLYTLYADASLSCTVTPTPRPSVSLQFHLWESEVLRMDRVNRGAKSLSPSSQFLPQGYLRVALHHPCHLWTRAAVPRQI